MWQQVIENKVLEQSCWQMTDEYLNEAEKELITVEQELESMLRNMKELRIALEGESQSLPKDTEYFVEAIA